MSLPDFALHSACASSPAPAAALQRAGSQVGGAVTALADLQAEHAACGVGWVASLRAEASHGVVQDALTVLKRLAHRGAVGSDPLTGDGAGILTQVPHALFAAESAKLHFTLPPPGRYAVGMFFLPKDPDFAARSEELAADVLQSLELKVLGWRTVPIDRHQCGVLGLQSMPTIRQLFLSQGQQRLDAAAFERLLYLARKRMERLGKVLGNGARAPFYVCSLSARTLVYKGLLLPDRLAAFYPDLSDPRYHSALAIVHQRFSTNTFPSWQRAHPYRYVAHNGEFNTLRGNVNWMKARERVLQSALFGDVVQELKPVIDEHGSDSAIFDNVLELLVQTGRSLPHAAVMMVPEAWQRHRTMSASKRAFYEYHAACMEPWDGPACIAFSDGRLIGSVLDRNGLRPSRYLITQDGRIIVASEAGVLDVPAAQIQSRGRLSPGRMLLVDTAKGRLISDDEIKESLAARQPYADWLKAHRVALEALPASRLDDLPRPLTGEALVAHQRAAAYSREDLYTLLVPMAQSGKEPIGAMGDDTPLAVLSAQAEPLFHYFKQRFAQVTNPPIDPIREELVMSLRTNLGPAANLFEETAAQCHQLTLDGPILTGERLHQIRILQRGRLKSAVVPCHYPPGEAEQGLLRGLASLEQRAEQAVRQGATILVLSDRGLSPERAMIPCLLAVAAVHHHLIRAGLRQQVGLVVETAEAREVMHVCL
ncbi:MAG: glutamate synthase central domain-containing protein, partial [Polyangiales bacterium]